MITPEGSGSGDRKPPKGKSLIGIAVLLVFGGLVAVGILSSPEPDPVAEPTTTTTTGQIESPIDTEDFTIGQIATGDPLEWGLSMAIDDHDPLALFEHDGSVYLFAVSGSSDTSESSGIRAWRSSDGLNWQALGEVISSGYRVLTLAPSPQGIVAAGNRLEDNALVVLESEDGTDWRVSDVRAAEGYHSDVPTAVGVSEDVLAVASDVWFDRESLLEERLRDIGIDLDLSSLRWNLQWLGETGHSVIVRGPLGIPILQQPIDALDLTDGERQELLSELLDPLWTDVSIRRGTTWSETALTDVRHVDSIFSAPGGELVAVGLGASGRVTRTSSRSVGWDRTDPVVSPEHIERWGDHLVGAVAGPDVAVSDDGTTWRTVGLADRFPEELHWSVTALGAGDGGVAVSLRGDRALLTLPTPQPEELAAQNGATFFLEFRGGLFEFVRPETSTTWRRAADGSPVTEGSMVVDPNARTVTLNDPVTGEKVASFTFEEIERAQREHNASLLPYEHLEAFAYSQEGDTWTVQDMSAEIGGEASIWLLEVTDDRAVAVVQDTLAGLTGSGPPGFEVWSAPIP